MRTITLGFGGDEMLAGLSNCTTVKVTPSTTLIISLSNPTGQIPKLVHVTSDANSHARTNYGFVLEMWLVPEFGNTWCVGTNGNNAYSYFTPVEQTPTTASTFYISTSAIEIYKGLGSTVHKWDTETEYTVEIYT